MGDKRCMWGIVLGEKNSDFISQPKSTHEHYSRFFRVHLDISKWKNLNHQIVLQHYTCFWTTALEYLIICYLGFSFHV